MIPIQKKANQLFYAGIIKAVFDLLDDLLGGFLIVPAGYQAINIAFAFWVELSVRTGSKTIRTDKATKPAHCLLAVWANTITKPVTGEADWRKKEVK